MHINNIYIYISPKRFELLHIPHQEIILPLNYRLCTLVFQKILIRTPFWIRTKIYTLEECSSTIELRG